MASPRAPEDPITPGVTGPEQQEDSPHGSSDGLQLPKGKEKKRVGFASDNQAQESSTLGSPLLLTPNELRTPTQDYFSFTPSPHSNASTPVHHDGHRRPSVDDAELF